jgi:hypothetical protein
LNAQHLPSGQCVLDVQGSHLWPSQCGRSLGHCSSHEHSMQLYSMPSQHLPSRQTVNPMGHADVLPSVHVGTVEQGPAGGTSLSWHRPPAPPVPTVVEVVPGPVELVPTVVVVVPDPPLPEAPLAPEDPELPPAPFVPSRPPHEAAPRTKTRRTKEFSSDTIMGTPTFGCGGFPSPVAANTQTDPTNAAFAPQPTGTYVPVSVSRIYRPLRDNP